MENKIDNTSSALKKIHVIEIYNYDYFSSYLDY